MGKFKITKRFIKQYAPYKKIAERGLNYYKNKAVSNIWIQSDFINAVVKGSHLNEYQIKITLGERQIVSFCNCPFSGICKHIIAVLYEYIEKKEALIKEAKFMDEDSKKFKRVLKKLSKDDIIDIILFISKKSNDIEKEILEHVNEKIDSNYIDISLYNKYLSTVDSLMEDYVTYGGVSSQDEGEIIDNIHKIINLIHEGKIDPKLKEEFKDFLLEYYITDNHALRDFLFEKIAHLVESKEEWKNILNIFKKNGEEKFKYDIEYILKEKLVDKDVYVKELKSNLNSVNDYYKLAKYWFKNNKPKKGLRVAKNGLKKADKITKARNNLYNLIFDYYDENGEYYKALKILDNKFENDVSLSVYKDVKNYVKKEDWQKLKTKFVELFKKNNNKRALAEIWMKEKKYEKVIGLMKRDNDLIIGYEHRGYYIDKLKDSYPYEIIDWLKKIVKRNIKDKNRSAYNLAANYAEVIKNIYINILDDKKEWENYIKKIRNKYNKRWALQEEFSEL